MIQNEALSRPPSASEEMFRELYSELWRVIDALERLSRDMEKVRRVGVTISGTRYQPGLLDAMDSLGRDVEWLSKNFYFRDKEFFADLDRRNSKHLEQVSKEINRFTESVIEAVGGICDQKIKIDRKLNRWRAGLVLVGLAVGVLIGYLAGQAVP